MILKTLVLAARVAVTTHRIASAVGATIFIGHSLYQLYRSRHKPKKTK